MAGDPSAPGPDWARWLGPKLSRVRLNVIEPRLDPGRPPRIAKRRRRFSSWLIGPGNFYLRRLDARVRVLRDRPWHARERAVHRRLFGIECEVDPRGWLLLPFWPGTVLVAYGADVRLPGDDRLRALAVASRTLRDLHQIELPLSDGVRGRFSHGDATLRNVIYDPASFRAHWFDFDTAHDPAEPARSRHADDLRALLYSALETLFDLPVPMILGTVRDAYDDPAVWDHLRSRLARTPLHWSPYHLAQASPPVGRCTDVERLLRGRE
jgi:hypothetical protein